MVLIDGRVSDGVLCNHPIITLQRNDLKIWDLALYDIHKVGMSGIDEKILRTGGTNKVRYTFRTVFVRYQRRLGIIRIQSQV